ncbi:hypothetical protein Mal4_48140 [Maioricimonas rarisocia]|uniref:Uncharacterized protein n=1 Tax=Maioricimonas rarisocia TaxID=2528026 RepID=A0A517ZDB4_9PLAN|nr:hypothetical protein [Maioricimonas rarisocia]QDU40457.1 hypothetical protein Mal4_48140 [Maioricimonas rarisocia]
MTAMRVELAFFDHEQLLCRDTILIVVEETVSEIHSERNETFRVTHQFEEPACRVFIKGFRSDRLLFRSAMRMGVHNSDDWEAVSLAAPFELCFRCTVVEDQTSLDDAASLARVRPEDP